MENVSCAIRNVNYIGSRKLLEAVRKAGIFTEAQMTRIEARVRIMTGADVRIFS